MLAIQTFARAFRSFHFQSLVNFMFITDNFYALFQAHEAADFLLPMLQYYPHKRATAEQMLSHPWLHSMQDFDVNVYLHEMEIER